MTTTPESLRVEGQHQAEAAADFRIIAAIDAVIARANESREIWDANEVRAQFPTARSGLVGARVDAARKRGEMVACGFVRSDLASTRGAWIKRWRGVPA